MSLCPTSLGHACTRQRGINHRAHRAQMRTWAMHKCRVADWLHGLRPLGHTAWKYVGSACHTQSRNLPKIHPGINRAAMRRDWQQHHH